MRLTVFEKCRNCQNIEKLLKILDVEYERKVFKSEKALAQKEFQEKAIYGKLPLLETTENHYLNNYYSIVFYVASKADIADLLGKDYHQKAAAQENLLDIKDIDNAIAKLEMAIKNPEAKNEQDMLYNELNSLFGNLEKRLKYNMFLLGTDLSYVDILMGFSFKWLDSVSPNAIKLPNIKRVLIFLENSGFL